MDLFVPTMLPPGAVHLKRSSSRPRTALHLPAARAEPLPLCLSLAENGIGKTAKKLGISYADACVRPPVSLRPDSRARPADRPTRTSASCAPQVNFQFKQKQAKAIPLLEGIVVAAENVDVVLEVRRCPSARRRVTLTPSCSRATPGPQGGAGARGGEGPDQAARARAQGLGAPHHRPQDPPAHAARVRQRAGAPLATALEPLFSKATG